MSILSPPTQSVSYDANGSGIFIPYSLPASSPSLLDGDTFPPPSTWPATLFLSASPFPNGMRPPSPVISLEVSPLHFTTDKSGSSADWLTRHLSRSPLPSSELPTQHPDPLSRTSVPSRLPSRLARPIPAQFRLEDRSRRRCIRYVDSLSLPSRRYIPRMTRPHPSLHVASHTFDWLVRCGSAQFPAFENETSFPLWAISPSVSIPLLPLNRVAPAGHDSIDRSIAMLMD